jgi:SAM-dependent methyltransferase
MAPPLSVWSHVMPSATSDELEALYAHSADPWDFRTSAYEQVKYRQTMAQLPRARYGDVLEVGCSIGVLGQMLARRCDRYLGIDASHRALETARATARPGMAFRHGMVPAWFPPGPFDLIVLSEVLYYLATPELRRLALRVRAAAPRGDIVCVNYLGDTGRDCGGAEALRTFAVALGRPLVQTVATAGYRIDVARGTRGGGRLTAGCRNAR